MDLIIGFAEGVAVSHWFWFTLAGLLLLSEHYESDCSYVLIAVATVTFFYATGVRPSWWGVPTYVVVGVLWTLWHYRNFVAYRIRHRRVWNKDTLAGKEESR